MTLTKYYSYVVLAVYILIAIFFTFPFLLNLGNFLIGRPLDGYLYLWNIDSFWAQIFSLKNPFYTYRIFFPVGANLALNTSAPLVSLFGLPFLKHLASYLNFLIFLSLPFSAFFTYRLIGKITGNKLAGFVSGLFYGFSPIMFSYIISQHFYFSFAAVFIPAGLYFCEEFLEKIGPWSLSKVFGFFWIVFLIDYYTSVLYLVICLLYIFSKIILLKRVREFFTPKKIFSYFNVIILVIIIPLIAYYFLVFSGSNLNTFSNGPNFYPSICSTKLPDFVIPSSLNPVLGKYSDNLRDYFNNPERGDTPYFFLGYISVLLGLTALFIKKYYLKTLPFLITGVVILILSMGPSAFLFKYFSRLPFMNFLDCPQRFAIGIQLALASLIGITFSLIVPKKESLRKLLLLMFLGIFVVEYGTRGLPLTRLTVPDVYRMIATDKNDLTVLELPGGLTESKGAFGYDWSVWGLNSMQMYWQTIYHKPKVGGYVSRIDEKTYSFFKNEPVISDLFTMTSLGGKWTEKKFSKIQIEKFMTKFNLGYIILSPNPRQSEFEKVIQNLFEGLIIKKDGSEGFVIYYLKTPANQR